MRIVASILTFAAFGVLMAVRADMSNLALRAMVAGLAFGGAAGVWLYIRTPRRDGRAG